MNNERLAKELIEMNHTVTKLEMKTNSIKNKKMYNFYHPHGQNL